jgi:hypothetical protein
VFIGPNLWLKMIFFASFAPPRLHLKLNFQKPHLKIPGPFPNNSNLIEFSIFDPKPARALGVCATQATSALSI